MIMFGEAEHENISFTLCVMDIIYSPICEKDFQIQS